MTRCAIVCAPDTNGNTSNEDTVPCGVGKTLYGHNTECWQCVYSQMIYGCQNLVTAVCVLGQFELIIN